MLKIQAIVLSVTASQDCSFKFASTGIECMACDLQQKAMCAMDFMIGTHYLCTCVDCPGNQYPHAAHCGVHAAGRLERASQRPVQQSAELHFDMTARHKSSPARTSHRHMQSWMLTQERTK